MELACDGNGSENEDGVPAMAATEAGVKVAVGVAVGVGVEVEVGVAVGTGVAIARLSSVSECDRGTAWSS